MASILWAAQYCSCRIQAAPILLELARRGHEVVALCTPPAEKWFADLGLKFRAERHVPPYDWGSADLRPFSPEEENSPDAFRRWFVDRIPDQCADVLEALDERRYEFVLADYLLFGPGFAAEKRGLPWGTYVNEIFDNSGAGFFAAIWNGARASVGLGPEPRPLAELRWWTTSPHLNLMLGFPELAPMPELPPYVHRVGPAFLDHPAPGREPEFLDGFGRARRAVLVSTSSTFNADADLVPAAAEALADVDVDVVATVPTGQELPPLAGGIHVVGYVPHSLLLGPVSALVCSGGLGTVARALAAGVPVVSVPRNVRDRAVASAVQRAGAGIALDPASLDAAGIRTAVLRLLDEPGFAAAAVRLRSAGECYRAPTRSADLIEAAIAQTATISPYEPARSARADPDARSPSRGRQR